MILGAKMDTEHTFHLPKIITSLNRLTWSEKASSHRVILPQQTVILFSLISLCLKLWSMASQIVLVMVSEWVEYQMSTRLRSLAGPQDCVLDPVQLWWRHGGWTSCFPLQIHSAPSPPCLCPARLASLGCINSSLLLWLLFGFGQWEALVDLSLDPVIWVLHLWTDWPNVGCLTTLDTLFSGSRMPTACLDGHLLIP